MIKWSVVQNDKFFTIKYPASPKTPVSKIEERLGIQLSAEGENIYLIPSLGSRKYDCCHCELHYPNK